MTEFTLEVLRAQHGDCLLLHHDGHLILIDGGPKDVYKDTLRPRLQTLMAAQPGQPLWLQLIMVSHIDDDHIIGLKDLFAEAVDRVENGDPAAWKAGELWFNALGPLVKAGGATTPTPAGGASVAGIAADVASAAPNGESEAVAASVPNGSALEGFAKQLGLAPNQEHFGGGVVQSVPGGTAKDIMPGLKFTVLGPPERRIDDLREQWQAWQAKQEKDAEATAILDRSVFNLSSIVVLAESDGKTMLLTGDARGDDIIEGLIDSGHLQQQGGPPFTADILKLPHHGSNRNVDARFFERVRARHYVASANGRDDNPDARMLDLLLAAHRGNATPWTLWLTYGGEPGDGLKHLPERLKQSFDGLADQPGLKIEFAKPGTSLRIAL